MKGVKIHETSRQPHAWLAPVQDQASKQPGTGLSLGIRFRNQGQDQQHQQVKHHVMFMRAGALCLVPSLASGSWCSH